MSTSKVFFALVLSVVARSVPEDEARRKVFTFSTDNLLFFIFNMVVVVPPDLAARDGTIKALELEALLPNNPLVAIAAPGGVVVVVFETILLCWNPSTPRNNGKETPDDTKAIEDSNARHVPRIVPANREAGTRYRLPAMVADLVVLCFAV
jgi:hypothetical protein